MVDNQTEMCSMIMNILDIAYEEAKQLVAFMTEQEYIKFEPNQLNTDRAVFLSSINSEMSAVSYKLSNIEFNFRKAALSTGISAVETYLDGDSLLKGDTPVMHLLLMCLRVLSNMRVELGKFDAELIDFLWKARLQRHLNVDDEYEAFHHHMVKQGQNPLSSIEYHHALDRLEKLHVIRLGDGMISLRERVVTNQRIGELG